MSLASSAPKRVGRYQLGKEIASGGMATVHFGSLEGTTIAIKRLHPHFAKDPDFHAMLLDEARLASRIRHPNVAATHEVIEHGDEMFVVMEYIEGETLARLSRAAERRHVRTPVGVVVAVIADVLRGLHAAHEATSTMGEPLMIVHRDVSPQNVIVGADGAARVVDFGVAKARGRSRTTRDGQLRGKLAYMAPEQVRGEGVTRRTDIYAAGILLWEMLTRQRLFGADTEQEVLAKVVLAVVQAPSRVVPGIDPALDAVTLRALHRDPAKRFATAEAMASALESCVPRASAQEVAAWVDVLAHETLVARRGLSKMAPEMGTPPAMSMAEIIVPPPKAKPWRTFALSAAVLTFGVGVGALGAWRVRSDATVISSRGPEVPASPPAASEAPPVIVQTPAAPPEPEAPTPTASSSSSAPISAATTPTLRVAYPMKPKPAVPSLRRACDPPYTLDAAGRRHFKPECF